MCLIATSRIPKVAKEDITVYKIARWCGDHDGMGNEIYQSPFVRRSYDIKMNEVLKPNDPFRWIVGGWIQSLVTKVVDIGFIHGYTDLDRFRDEIRYNLNFNKLFVNYRYLKGYIPKGTLYYIDGYGQVATKKLVLNKHINSYQLEKL